MDQGYGGLYSWARHGHIETWAAYKVPLCPFVKTLFLRSNAILVVLNPTRCNLLLPGSHVHGTGAYQKGFGIRAARLHLHRMEAFKQMKTMRCGSMVGQVGPEVLVRPGYQGLEPCRSCRNCYRGFLLVQLKFGPHPGTFLSTQEKASDEPFLFWKKLLLVDLIAIFNQHLIPTNSIMSCHKKLLEQWPCKS